AFLIGSLSIIGLPPLGGSWSKWYLMVGAADAGQLIMIGVLMLSSLLNVAYLLPIVARGFFLPGPNYASQDEETSGIRRSAIREAPLTCVIPLSITAIGCILLFFFADSLYD
ncbi:MAG: monovalent cation/H+ antiporter subunit D family protein, partial [Candidatus Competibacteraceae bacterium]|nr:monovalent cation/H+ antiporter subunit D family protein [Candidatus Competibacteraceae bacterium]